MVGHMGVGIIVGIVLTFIFIACAAACYTYYEYWMDERFIKYQVRPHHYHGVYAIVHKVGFFKAEVSFSQKVYKPKSIWLWQLKPIKAKIYHISELRRKSQ